ncbi:3-keto-5-aminohexanoate cleavage protein [Candidatus Micrarchaeota archaeon]|nr:3-keto-5-aminohexanoate cleavage protein [Candidatus Micrarchaeota archaeon]
MPHMRKLIIHVALTGNYSMKSVNPHVPYGPEEIAEDARRCFKAGASSFHIHAREADGKPSYRKELFEEIVAKVKAGCPGAIICLTTSGRVFKTFGQRAAVLDIDGKLKPDFASLSLGSMNFPKEPSINSPEMIENLARKMLERGIRPELEAFETGMVNHSAYLLRKGILQGPLHFNLFFGLPGTMPGRMVDIIHQVSSLPQGSTWCAAGGGRFQLPVNMAAILMGGHVRVGLEDNLFYDNEKTVPATNEMLVQRVVRVANELGRPIAKPEEAREVLGVRRQ